MKAIKIIYWITTSLVALMMTYSTYAYLTQPAMKQAFQHLGFPDYFRIELAVAKLLGAVLLIAAVTARVKEWVYAAFTIAFVSAFIAHTASGDAVNYRIIPVIFLVLLIASYVTFHRQNSSTASK